MFRIECFCDDAKLAKIKWALYELGAYNVTDNPVKDTKPNGHVRPKNRNVPSAELVREFIAYAKKHKLTQIKAQQIREFTEALGFSEGSYSHVLTKLKALGAVARIPSKGTQDAAWRFTPSKIKKSVTKEAATS